MNITSVVVQTNSWHMADVLGSLQRVEGCQVHFTDDEGKIIITVEGQSQDEDMKTLRTISELPHVLSANMAFTCSDTED